MQIAVTFRRLESSDAVRAYAENRLQKLKRCLDEPIEVSLVLSAEKFRQRAEAVIAAQGVKIKAVEEKDDMYAAIDLLLDNVQEQIRRQQERRKKKNGAAVRAQKVLMEVFSADGADETPESGLRIVKTELLLAKPMDLEEAVAQMRISADEFLVFTSAETGTVSVLYRLKGGNLGLLATE
ncbi:MAG: ribosome-associated translation inhibitor RaiA [Thermodesulfobacteriota bacterium]